MSLEDIGAAVHAAEAERRRGDMRAARAIYSAAVASRIDAARRSAAALLPEDLLVIEQLAGLVAVTGQPRKAIDLLSVVVWGANLRSDVAGADRARLKQLHFFLTDGDFDEARRILSDLAPRIGDVETIDVSDDGLQRYEEAIKWQSSNRTRLLPSLYYELARFAAGLGMPATAVALARRGMTLAGTAASSEIRELTVPLELTIAGALIDLGDARAAAAVLDALTIDTALHPGWALLALELRGRSAFLRGKLRQALDAFTAAAELADRSNSPRAAAAAHLNLGELRLALNQTGDAEHFLAVAAAYDDPMLREHVALLRAHIARGSGVRDSDLQAAAELQRAVVPGEPAGAAAAVTAPRDADFLAWFDRRALALRMSLGDARARPLLARMREDFAHSESPLIRARLGVLEAMMLLADTRASREPGPEQHIDDLFLTFIDFATAMQLDYELYEALRLLTAHRRERRAANEMTDPLVARAQDILDRMCEGLSPAEHAQFLLNKWNQDEESLAIDINQILDRQKRRRRFTRWVGEARAAHQLLHRAFGLRMALGSRSNRLAQPAPLRRLLFAPLRTSVLAFIVLPENVVILRFGWFDATFRVIRISRIEVRALVRRWHEGVTGISEEDPAVIANTLAERLGLSELLDLPHRIRSLAILPDDALHGFPFSALRLNGRYLVERFAISIVHEPFQRRESRATRGNACVIAVDREMPGWRALPDTPAQIEDVAAFAARHSLSLDIVLNQPIAHADLLSRMKQASILHLSCHGTFSAEEPDDTGLVLLGDNGQPQLLALKDIGNADLGEVEHACVVACWGADNYVLPGRWVVSFPEVLCRAGVRSVLGSLWEIDDQRVTSMLKRFYRNADTMPRDEALRQVQIEELSSSANRDPIWWAGFQLYGETRPIW
jgi:hypothetical protein